jgi:glycosyltransferase involved in cell wall biosynthesis
MKIALLAFHFAEYAARLAMALAESHDVLLILSKRNADAELTQLVLSRLHSRVRVMMVTLPRTRNPEWVARAFWLKQHILNFRPDVIHVQETIDSTAYLSLRLLRRAGPLVLTVHDHVPHSGAAAIGRLAEYYIKDIRRRCDAVVVHGETIAKEYAGLADGAGKLIFPIPHGILGAHQISDGEPSEVWPERPPACTGNSILFFGRMEPYKGLTVLLEACDILRSAGLRFELVVAGRGEDLVKHRAAMEKRAWVKLIDRFIPADEVSTLFGSAKLVVLPYTDATQSGVAAIALAHGIPVVASAVGGIPEVVIDGQTGLLVPPGDAAALSRAMARLLTDDELARQVGEGAAEFAKSHLSWVHIARATAKVYETVTRKRRAVSRDAVCP